MSHEVRGGGWSVDFEDGLFRNPNTFSVRRWRLEEELTVRKSISIVLTQRTESHLTQSFMGVSAIMSFGF